MAVIELTKDNFESTIWGNDVVLVDFWAPWHASSQSYTPIYEAASEKHADIVFAKVNTEVEQELAGYFQIRSIPTLMLFREGVILYSEAGSLPADGLHTLIEQVMQFDMEDVRQGIAKREAQGQP
jgi:thioredoxin